MMVFDVWRAYQPNFVSVILVASETRVLLYSKERYGAERFQICHFGNKQLPNNPLFNFQKH